MKAITGLFDDYEDAASAVGELEAIGVPHSDISIIASNSSGWYDYGKVENSDAAEGAASGAGIGAVVGGAGGLLTGLGLMAIPGVGPVVAAGWLAATAVGALGGAVVGGATGGMVGALTNSGIPEEDANVYAEGVRRGGTLVTAKVSEELVAEAQDILSNANSVNLEQRRTSYKEGDGIRSIQTPVTILRTRLQTTAREPQTGYNRSIRCSRAADFPARRTTSTLFNHRRRA